VAGPPSLKRYGAAGECRVNDERPTSILVFLAGRAGAHGSPEFLRRRISFRASNLYLRSRSVIRERFKPEASGQRQRALGALPENSDIARNPKRR
jgi:hypothetical protein